MSLQKPPPHPPLSLLCIYSLRFHSPLICFLLSPRDSRFFFFLPSDLKPLAERSCCCRHVAPDKPSRCPSFPPSPCPTTHPSLQLTPTPSCFPPVPFPSMCIFHASSQTRTVFFHNQPPSCMFLHAVEMNSFYSTQVLAAIRAMFLDSMGYGQAAVCGHYLRLISKPKEIQFRPIRKYGSEGKARARFRSLIKSLFWLRRGGIFGTCGGDLAEIAFSLDQ